MANPHPNRGEEWNKRAGKIQEIKEHYNRTQGLLLGKTAEQLGAEKGNQRKKEKKQMKEILNLMLQCKCNKKEEDVINNLFPDLKDEKKTKQYLLLIRQFKNALNGDNKSFEIIRDTSGQKPKESQEVEVKQAPIIDIDKETYKMMVEDFEKEQNSK